MVVMILTLLGLPRALGEEQLVLLDGYRGREHLGHQGAGGDRYYVRYCVLPQHVCVCVYNACIVCNVYYLSMCVCVQCVYSVYCAIPQCVSQGQDPQDKEVHGEQEVDVLLTEHLKHNTRTVSTTCTSTISRIITMTISITITSTITIIIIITGTIDTSTIITLWPLSFSRDNGQMFPLYQSTVIERVELT